jgi:hypothetical protein
MILIFSSYYPPFFSHYSPTILLLLSSPSPAIILFLLILLSVFFHSYSPLFASRSLPTPPPFISYSPSVLLLYSSVSPLQSRFSLKNIWFSAQSLSCFWQDIDSENWLRWSKYKPSNQASNCLPNSWRSFLRGIQSGSWASCR